MRKLYLLDEINDTLYEEFTKELDRLVEESSTKPIQLEISSQGGSQYVALAMCGRINTCPVQIKAKAYGTCMSAATLIFAACDVREAAEETWFMFHDSKDSAKGTASDVLAQGRQTMKEEMQWAALLEKHTGTREDTWLHLSNQTTYLNAEAAMGLGLVDKILKGKV